MTSSRERGKTPVPSGLASAISGQGGAHLNGCAEVGLGGAVLSERALHLATGATNAQRSRGTLCKGPCRIEDVDAAYAARRRRETATNPFNWSEQGRAREAAEDERRRGPRRHLEDVLQRPPLFNVYREVRWALRQGEMRRRPRQRGAHALDGTVGLLRAKGCGRTAHEEAQEQRAGTKAHAVRTFWMSRRPVQWGTL
jgi:hypothetical protein